MIAEMVIQERAKEELQRLSEMVVNRQNAVELLGHPEQIVRVTAAVWLLNHCKTCSRELLFGRCWACDACE